MAAVDLVTVWINAADDPSDGVALIAATRLSRTQQTSAEFQQTPVRQRMVVTGVPRLRTWTLDCDGVTDAELKWLRDHEAVLCCFRDPTGDKMYGSWSVTSDSPFWSSGWSKFEMTITEITYSEAV